MEPTAAQLEAVFNAALDLLGARQDQMVTVEEWTALARAVAACRGRPTAEYLTDRDLRDIAGSVVQSGDWDPDRDGALSQDDGD